MFMFSFIKMSVDGFTITSFLFLLWMSFLNLWSLCFYIKNKWICQIINKKLFWVCKQNYLWICEIKRNEWTTKKRINDKLKTVDKIRGKRIRIVFVRHSWTISVSCRLYWEKKHKSVYSYTRRRLSNENSDIEMGPEVLPGVNTVKNKMIDKNLI